jgi:dCMP deaminase
MRKDWDSYYLDIAFKVAERSTCNRANVGCVIVKDNLQLAEGYNGSISEHKHCDEVGHLMHDGHCIRTIHAEMNSILNAMKKGVSIQGATAYITHQPCHNCTKHLNQAGIKKIVYHHEYRNELTSNFIFGINLKKL